MKSLLLFYQAKSHRRKIIKIYFTMILNPRLKNKFMLRRARRGRTHRRFGHFLCGNALTTQT